MTEQELETIRIRIRLEIFRMLFSNVYTWLARLSSPNVAPILLESFEELRKSHSRVFLTGVAPEYSDMMSAEYQEALDEILKQIEDGLRNAGAKKA